VFCTGTSGTGDLVNAAIQPDIQPALSQKACKPAKRIDKQENTYEADPMFLAFTAALAKPVEKLLSAEAQYDLRKAAAATAASNNGGAGGATSGSAATAALQELMKDNPLLKYMREKAEKKLSSRRLGKGGRGSAAAAGGTGVSAKGLKVTALLKKNRDPSASGGSGGGADTGTGGGGKDKSRSSRGGKSGKGERPPRKERETGVRTMCFLTWFCSVVLYIWCYPRQFCCLFTILIFHLSYKTCASDPSVDVAFWISFYWFSFPLLTCCCLCFVLHCSGSRFL
jgi:hypothetical protein